MGVCLRLIFLIGIIWAVIFDGPYAAYIAPACIAGLVVLVVGSFLINLFMLRKIDTTNFYRFKLSEWGGLCRKKQI